MLANLSMTASSALSYPTSEAKSSTFKSMFTFIKLGQSLNTSSPNDDIALGMSNDFKLAHLSNALLSIELRLH